MLHYFQQKTINPFSESLEQPVKELMDLNVKALQSMSYLTPTELLTMKRPEDMMEKNMQMFIDNSNAALAYMHNMFNIMEKHWLKNVDQMLKNTPSNAKQATHTTSSSTKDSSKKSASKTTTTKARPSTMKSKSSSTKSASTKKKPIKHAAVTMSKDNKAPSKTHTVTSEVKHTSTGSPHMASSTSHMKPVMDKK